MAAPVFGQLYGASADSPGASPAAADSAPVLPAPIPEPFNEERILGVIPDYQTVTETTRTGTVAPLTRKQKWTLAVKETIDPFNLMNAVVGAGFSQMGNQTPKYGEGGPAFGERFGAAFADFGTQNFLSAGVFATLLHQDPRYFRKGPQAKVPGRVLYSISRLFVCRQDSGRSAFNASGIFGMSLGIAASNLYYPSASVRGSVMAGRIETSLLSGVTGNLMSEFWPDIQRKFFHRKHRD
ncbi:MAG TPA: hypothetical protein VGZ73_25875 [Bryobacteraceae bacterium]|jgi:hypothetical protein|nr:hypothetical protein [Bryobacteraceae bacterium]